MIQYMLTAIKDRLNAAVISGILGSKAAGCSVCDSGRPTQPFNGLIFLGVHGGRVISNNQSGGYFSDERYDFSVTVTLKSAHIQKYKIGELLFETKEGGIYYLTDLVKSALHGYLSLSEEADSLLMKDYPNSQGFLFGEPPLFTGSDEPVERDGSWFGANIDSNGHMMGVSCRSGFSGLRIIRTINSIQTQVV